MPFRSQKGVFVAMQFEKSDHLHGVLLIMSR